MSETSNLERFAELPPSAKLVCRVLEVDGPVTLQSICEQTGLVESTTRYALGHLSKAEVLVSRPDPLDARQRLYELDPD